MQPGLMQLDVVQPDEIRLDVIQLYMLILVLMHCPGDGSWLDGQGREGRGLDLAEASEVYGFSVSLRSTYECKLDWLLHFCTCFISCPVKSNIKQLTSCILFFDSELFEQNKCSW